MDRFDFKKSGKRNKFGVGTANTRILEALYKKYSRDYLKYFKELSDNYKIGPNKEEVDKSVELVKRILVVLENVISTGIITEEDSANLKEYSENIELQKQYFLEEVQNDKVLQQLISIIDEKTGIPLEQMGSAEEVVKKGIQQLQRSKVREAAPFRERAPHIAALGKDIGKSLAVAATGPFYPLLEKAYGVGQDIFSLGRGAAQRRRSKEEESTIGEVSPSSFRTPRSREAQESRTSGASLGSMVGVAQKETLDKQVAPLKRFFDKEAYQTKWTKELLEATKEAKEKKDMGFVDILSSKFGSLKDVLILTLPLLAKFGIALGALAASAWSVKQVWDLIKKLADLGGASGERREAGEAAANAAQQQINVMQEMGLSDYSKGLGKTPEQVALDIAYLERRGQMESKAPRWPKSWKEAWKLPLFAYDAVKNIITEDRQPLAERAKEIEKMGEQPLKIEIPPIPGLDGLIEKLNEQLQKSQEKETAAVPVKTGNVFDSGDTLLTEHAKGSLSLGGY